MASSAMTCIVRIIAFCILANLPLASSRGCFVGTVEITLADGQRKQLHHVQVGDLLASFDDSTGNPAVSTVMAVPKFQRHSSHLIEILLPRSNIQVTRDHPFWSRGRNGLVSGHPNQTMDEYGLHAVAMNHDEELEDEQQQGVGISGIVEVPFRSLSSSTLRGSREDVEVMTLCMHPHHWYYVNGVRVHNKGCFVPSTPISLADGTRKELRHIAVGDNVSSWDEALGRVVTSTVLAVPTFQRPASELMEVSLPSAAIHVTQDHPFWSKGRNGIVSLLPSQTHEEYDLEAELMTVGEQLDGEGLEQHVPVVGLRQVFSSAETSDSVGLADSEKFVEVMTLCLQPHHWYYAHGVRVHNKGGCFAPWTQVLMSDHTHKPIAEVREQDRVISWDETTGQTGIATVLGVAEFPAAGLLEISLNTTHAWHHLQSDDLRPAADSSATSATQLVVTRDHPVYSARTRSVVSMDPSRSRELYGLAVDQMLEDELLRHYLGHDVHAKVRAWNGSVETVMTLRLDRHHWFHVHGVRVHNKGGGSGGGGGGGSFSSTSTVRTTRSSYHGSWMFLVMSNRGTYHHRSYRQKDKGRCQVKSEAQVEELCYSTGLGDRATGNQEPCYSCFQCDTESCARAMGTACVRFLEDAYEYCEEDEEGGGAALVIVLVGLFCGCPCFLFCLFLVWSNYRKKNSRSEAFNNRALQREQMQSANDVNLGPAINFNGTYTENGETKPIRSNFNIAPDGSFTGETHDDDGMATCTGKILWTQSMVQGQIAWLEQRSGVEIETSGTLSMVAGAIHLQASYDSTYDNTQGVLNMTAPGSGFQAPPAAPVVMGAHVAPATPVVMGTHVQPIPGTVVSQETPESEVQPFTKSS